MRPIFQMVAVSMSEEEYLKCECKECGNFIEFPPAMSGNTIECPLCKQWTELETVNTEEESESKDMLLFGVAIFIALLIVLGGAVYWLQSARGKKTIPKAVVTATDTADHDAAVAAKAALAAAAKTNVATTNTAPAKERSLADFESSEIRLEKTKGNSLIYAIGTLTNDSDYQRFGIKVQLEMLNKNGKTLGTSQDYKEIMEPHAVWQFRALVLDSKTAAVKLAAIKEE